MPKKNTTRKLFQLSDATGTMEFKLVGEGVKIRRNQLDGNDVFIFDSGAEVFAWIGRGASVDERKKNQCSMLRNTLQSTRDHCTHPFVVSWKVVKMKCSNLCSVK